MCNRSIMSDIQRDNRVVSLSSRAGIRNSLVTILDQLQRCQKSLNEFLEVDTCSHFSIERVTMCNMGCHNLFFVACVCVFFAGEALCLPTILFHRRRWSVRDSWSGNKPNSHPVTPQETLCRSQTSVFIVLCSLLWSLLRSPFSWSFVS